MKVELDALLLKILDRTSKGLTVEDEEALYANLWEARDRMN